MGVGKHKCLACHFDLIPCYFNYTKYSSLKKKQKLFYFSNVPDRNIPILDFKAGFVWNFLLIAHIGIGKDTLVDPNLLLLLLYLLLYGLFLSSQSFKDHINNMFI